MNHYLKNLLNNRLLLKKKYSTFNKLFLILSLLLFNIGFIAFINKNIKIFYICEFIILLELILFSILAFYSRKNDTKVIKHLEKSNARLNLDDLNTLLLKCSKFRKFLDLFGNIVLIISLLVFLYALSVQIDTQTNLFIYIKNITLTLFFIMSFLEWKYSRLLDRTISVIDITLYD